MERKGRNIPPNNLRMRRLGKNLQQKEMMKKLGLKSSNRISRWEAGLSIPSLEHLFEMEYFYDTLIQDLFADLRDEIRAKCKQREQEDSGKKS